MARKQENAVRARSVVLCALLYSCRTYHTTTPCMKWLKATRRLSFPLFLSLL